MRYKDRVLPRRLGNKGSVDFQAWIVGILGFASTYMVYVFLQPVMKAMYDTANSPSMGLPSTIINKLPIFQTCYDYGMLILAGGWILYIIYSSIRKEVEERVTTQRYY